MNEMRLWSICPIAAGDTSDLRGDNYEICRQEAHRYFLRPGSQHVCQMSPCSWPFFSPAPSCTDVCSRSTYFREERSSSTQQSRKDISQVASLCRTSDGMVRASNATAILKPTSVWLVWTPS